MFEPDGMKVEIYYADGSWIPVSKDKFSATPSLDTPLTKDITFITIAYLGRTAKRDGKTATVEITVMPKND